MFSSETCGHLVPDDRRYFGLALSLGFRSKALTTIGDLTVQSFFLPKYMPENMFPRTDKLVFNFGVPIFFFFFHQSPSNKLFASDLFSPSRSEVRPYGTLKR